MPDEVLKYHLRGENGEVKYLIESEDMFIVRTKNLIDPKILFQKYLDPADVDLIASNPIEFPEASVFLYKLTGIGSVNTRLRIKEALKASGDERMKFIGTVMVDRETGTYQIYTGNIYLQFHPKIQSEELDRVILKYNLELKMNLGFQKNAMFMMPGNESDEGREIFRLCEDLLREMSVFLCHPEIVVKRRTFKTRVTQSNEAKADSDWMRELINLDEAWQTTKGEGVKICIIDDGIDHEHPAFLGSKIYSSRNMLGDSELEDASHKFDSEAHGTAVASVAASNDPLAMGVAPGAQLIIVRSKGLGSVLEAEAIRWAVDEGADIISCSWGPPDKSLLSADDPSNFYPIPDHTRQAIDYAVEKGRNGLGCLVFFAAGNGAEQIKYDGYAKYKNVLAIGSVNKERQLSQYSDSGYPIFCCFPSSEIVIGENIITIYGLTAADRRGSSGLDPSDYIATFGGTSASAPGMAGIAALMFSICPEVSLWDAKRVLADSCRTAKGIKLKVEDENYGWGIIDASLVVENSKKIKNRPMSNSEKPKGYALHVALNKVDHDFYPSISDLQGCINDSERYKSISETFGFEVIELHDRNATREGFRTALESLANKAIDGDFVFITYTGHGGLVNDLDGDEETDNTDETLCLYNGQWIDDETKNILHDFSEGVRVLWISDSCHSGTNTKGLVQEIGSVSNRRERLYRGSQNQFELQKEYYRSELAKLKFRGEALQNIKFKARVITVAACQDVQTALEISNNGLFTTAFFNALKSDYGQSVRDLEDDITSFIQEKGSPHKQNIRIEVYGGGEEQLDQLPLKSFFDVEKIEGQKKPVESAVELPKQDTELMIPSGSLLLEEEETQLSRNGSEIRLARTRNFRGEQDLTNNAWDQAYEYLLENDCGFVEPDLASVINPEPSESVRSSSPDDYLDTYPSPEANFPNRLVWHLDDQFSELRSAALDACPELGIDLPQDPKEYPLIVHIDTGIISGHPSLPIHFDVKKSNDYTNPSDRDAKLLGKIAEQKGHGNATVTLLAGKGFETDLPDDDVMPDYLGGFPYARVVSLKISETVILLRGKAFARAVDYAIDIDADVITMSMAGAPSKRMMRAVNRAYENGIVIVAAGGNCWSKGAQSVLPKTLMYPARFGRVIAAIGTTFDETPYLNRLNKTRGVGGLYMQSCYGPAKVMGTALAAYTPNTCWVSTLSGSMYSRQGGGTSSATPQVAAAAALYIHKYKEDFKKLNKKSDKWKKVELVRHALFSAAKKDSQYQEYYGEGILKAKRALNVRPDLNNIKDKTPRDRLGITGIDEAIGLWMNLRGNSKENMPEMMSMEINQLITVEPDLDDHQNDEKITLALAQKLVGHKNSSGFLKTILKNRFSLEDSTLTKSSSKEMTPIYRHVSENEEIRYWASNKPDIKDLKLTQDDKVNGVEAKIELDFTSFPGETRSASGVNLGFTKTQNNTHLHLVEAIFEDGSSQAKWVFQESEKQNKERSVSGLTPAYLRKEEVFVSLMHDQDASTRGLGKWIKSFGKKIKKMIVTVVRLIQDEPNSGLDGLIECSLSDTSDWKPFNAKIKSDKKQLLLLHGAWSHTEHSFKDLLSDHDFVAQLKKSGHSRILGFDRPTIGNGIHDSAEKLANALESNVNLDNLCIVAHGQACLMARKAFSQNAQMILVAGPHQGTPLAEAENMIKMLNRITNLFLLSSGPAAPLLKSIVKFATLLGKKVYSSPGILDQAPESDLLNSLKASKNALFIGSNYEPEEKAIKRLSDASIDRVIFKNVNNDGVVPTRSALNIEGDKWEDNQILINDRVTGHFGYFKNAVVQDAILKYLNA